MIIKIADVHDGRMLRSYLKLTLGLSAAALSKLKNHPEGILVNGQRVTVRYVLRAGDVLTLAEADTVETATEAVIPTELPLSVLYEDDYVIVLNKPPFMPTHPSHGHLTDTLGNALAYRYAALGIPFVFRPLGRLDRNTSGVVVAGKSRAASGALGRALLDGKITKRYLAILIGEMPCDGITHTLETYVYRPDHQGIRRAVCAPDTPGAEPAVTEYRVLAVGHGLSLVLAQPKTGRTHQLRVHFSYLGHPILGDEIYGTTNAVIPRHALHALSLSLPLPFAAAGGFESPQSPCLNAPDAEGLLHTWAPLPTDMQSLLDTYFPDVIPTMPSPDFLHQLGFDKNSEDVSLTQ